MTNRRRPLALIGAALVLIAAVLLAAVAIPRRRPVVDAAAEGRSACRAFEDVYAATKPGTPFDGRTLARKLEQATGEMHRAASADEDWGPAARALDDLGTAVNAGDARTSHVLMQMIHKRCDEAERKA